LQQFIGLQQFIINEEESEMIPLLPIALLTVVSTATATATAIYLNEKKRRAIEGLDEEEMGSGGGETIAAKIKKKAKERHSDIEQLKTQLQEHGKILKDHANQLRNQSSSRH
jgi:hypothetical protein